ncbi:DinB family protein [Actinokineospora pegani]|uniref:hypothetical protein n=1 Tax=Actinokineospora pegani TaxID=2654637 RepID=UPI0012EA6308|nr:hypothetical protein [Actinokineospora pegani]
MSDFTPADVDEAVHWFVDTFSDTPAADWESLAGPLTWTCWETAEHVADDLFFYATQLTTRTPPRETHLPFSCTANREGGPENTVGADRAGGVPGLLAVVESCGHLLSAVITTADPNLVAHHTYGQARPEGFAAMGVVELLVHAYDIATGLGTPWTPPTPLVTRTLTKLFPHVEPTDDPAATLLWATGRGTLPNRPPVGEWRWINTH